MIAGNGCAGPRHRLATTDAPPPPLEPALEADSKHSLAPLVVPPIGETADSNSNSEADSGSDSLVWALEAADSLLWAPMSTRAHWCWRLDSRPPNRALFAMPSIGETAASGSTRTRRPTRITEARHRRRKSVILGLTLLTCASAAPESAAVPTSAVRRYVTRAEMISADDACGRAFYKTHASYPAVRSSVYNMLS